MALFNRSDFVIKSEYFPKMGSNSGHVQASVQTVNNLVHIWGLILSVKLAILLCSYNK